MENLLDNKAILYYLSQLGGAMGGEGSVAEAIGGTTMQTIQTQNYQKMLKGLLAGGAKVTMDKDTMNIKAPAAAFESGGGAGGTGAGAGTTGTKESLPGSRGVMSDLVNPSASPLGGGIADLVGLTPQDISQAMQIRLASEELGRKKVSDINEAAYRRTAMRKMEAETEAITPSITIPGTDIKLTSPQWIKWYKEANKDERTIKMREFDRAVSEGYEGKFEDWMMSLAKAAGGIEEFTKKKKIAAHIKTESKLSGPDFPTDVKGSLMKDTLAWNYPPTYDKWVEQGYSEVESIERGQKLMVLTEMDSRVRSFYKGKKVEKRLDGWYIGGEIKVRNPYYEP